MIIGVVAGFALFGGLALLSVEAMFHGSDAYKMALSKAQASPCITGKLGTPFVAKWMVLGNISINNSTGSADLEISLHGPRAEGELDVLAARSNGSWTITSLTLIHDGGQIHLLPVPSPCE